MPDAMPVVPTKPPESGLHLVEWACELIGTALLLVGGLSAVTLDFGSGSPFTSWATSPKLLLTGLLFAGTGSLLSVTPLGRRSGAHFNPVVTVVFWTQGKVHQHDVAGYVISQVLGALLGTAVIRLLWGHQAQALHFGATAPGHGLSRPEAAGLEAVMTAVLLLAILLMTSSPRSARFTPLVLWPLIALLVWQGAPYTGTSLNPARSFGPAVFADLLSSFWVYLVGPLAGGLLAVGVFATIKDRRVLTAKLFHDPAYPTTLGVSLPTVGQRATTSPVP